MNEEFNDNGLAPSDAAIETTSDVTSAVSDTVDPVAPRIAGLEDQITRLSLIVSRIIAHLDPARTSHTLDIEDLL
jgi:hypothetical protein